MRGDRGYVIPGAHRKAWNPREESKRREAETERGGAVSVSPLYLVLTRTPVTASPRLREGWRDETKSSKITVVDHLSILPWRTPD
jgi:hypothetical protein